MEKYKLQEKIDLLHLDALEMKKIKADVVFINPSLSGDDLLKDSRPDLKQLVEVAKSMTSNIIIQLPSTIDLQQLTYLFAGECIEIEQILIESKLEYYIVYYGNQAQIF